MKMFFLGILIMSIVATIGQALEDRGYYKGALLCGPAIWIVAIFGFIYGKVTRWYRYHNLRALLVDRNDTVWAVPCSMVESLRCYLGWEFPKSYPSKEEAEKDGHPNAYLARLQMEKFKHKWNKSLCAPAPMGKFYVNARYCPKIVWSQYPKITREIIKKVRKEEKENP